ncbi:hypothetical protein BVRB_4g074170 [Beta vulgaris subsp. vulgaris]|nr:hypothetical protein BVRB_4g074170 [Beta vulgaris subsp. vulgaris]
MAASVQQAQGVNQLSNKEKAAIDEAVKEAAIDIKNAKASQNHLVMVAGVIKNLQSRRLFLNKQYIMKGKYVIPPPETLTSDIPGKFVQEGAPSQGQLPVVVGAKAAVIYSPLDKALPSLGWLLAWYKPAEGSEEKNKVYVEVGDLSKLLNMKESEIEQKLDASHDESHCPGAAARIEDSKDDSRVAMLGASFFEFLPQS